MLNFTRPYVITIQRVKRGNLIVLWVILGPSQAGTNFPLKPGFHQRRKRNRNTRKFSSALIISTFRENKTLIYNKLMCLRMLLASLVKSRLKQ